MKSDGDKAEERWREIESKRGERLIERDTEEERQRETAREVVSATEERKVGDGI